MLDRTKLVLSLMRTADRIVATRDFARDAKRYAEIARDLEDDEAATALHTMAAAREAELAVMRAFMGDLASMLAEMPLDPD